MTRIAQTTFNRPNLALLALVVVAGGVAVFAEGYGGSGQGNYGGVEAAAIKWQNRPYSIKMTLPPLGAVFFTSRVEEEAAAEIRNPKSEIREKSE